MNLPFFFVLSALRDRNPREFTNIGSRTEADNVFSTKFMKGEVMVVTAEYVDVE